MSETVYTDPALAASKEPFNSPIIVLQQSNYSNFQKMTDKFNERTPMPGIFRGSITPGRIPSLAALFSQTAGFMLAYKAIGKINAVSEAIDQEAKTLECNKRLNYELYYTPNGFVGMAPIGKGSILPTGSEIIPKTIIGTNCQRPLFLMTSGEEETIKSIRKQIDQIKKDSRE